VYFFQVRRAFRTSPRRRRGPMAPLRHPVLHWEVLGLCRRRGLWGFESHGNHYQHLHQHGRFRIKCWWRQQWQSLEKSKLLPNRHCGRVQDYHTQRGGSLQPSLRLRGCYMRVTGEIKCWQLSGTLSWLKWVQETLRNWQTRIGCDRKICDWFAPYRKSF